MNKFYQKHDNFEMADINENNDDNNIFVYDDMNNGDLLSISQNDQWNYDSIVDVEEMQTQPEVSKKKRANTIGELFH